MTNASKLLAAALVFSVTDHARTRFSARKAANLYLNAHTAFETEIKSQAAQIDFLTKKLDEHEVPITEFDRIAYFNL